MPSVRQFAVTSAGSPPAALENGLSGQHEFCRVVLFDLDHTPRPDVEGVFLQALRAGLHADRDRALVFLDCSGAGPRNATRERRDELVQAWREVVAGAGMNIVELNLHGPVGDFSVTDEMIAEVRAGLWPTPGETKEA